MHIYIEYPHTYVHILTPKSCTRGKTYMNTAIIHTTSMQNDKYYVRRHIHKNNKNELTKLTYICGRQKINVLGEYKHYQL